MAITLGVALLVGVVAYYGFEQVGRAFAQAGWGILWVSLFHCVPLVTETLGWRQLYPPGQRPRFGRMYLFRWIGESINNLLPVGHVGGDVVRARLAAPPGQSKAASGAATVVDFTLGLLTQLLVALIGLGILIARHGLTGPVRWIVFGVVAFTAFALTLLIAQRFGIFARAGKLGTLLLRQATEGSASQLADKGERLDARIAEVYARRRSLFACVAIRFVSWSIGAAEILLALYFLGRPVDFFGAFAIHGLTMAIRSIAFLIPAGLGVQEGGFAVIGELLGLSGPTSVALALIRRVRELLIGVPGLVIWWLLETHRIRMRAMNRPTIHE